MFSVPLERWVVADIIGQFATGFDLTPALVGATVWIAIALVVGAVLLLGWPQSTRAVRDELVARPDRSFAVGFVIWFGLVVLSLTPAIAGTVLAVQPLATLGAVVMWPGLLVCGVLAIGGGCVAVIAVGNRLSSAARGDSQSSWVGLLVGVGVLGAAQLMPILGALVTIGAAIFGTGAIVLVKWGETRWIDALVSSDDPSSDELDQKRPVESHHGWIADAESSADSRTETRAKSRVGTSTRTSTNSDSRASAGTKGANPDSSATWDTGSPGSDAGSGTVEDAEDRTAEPTPQDEPQTDPWSETGFKAATPRAPSSDDSETSRDDSEDEDTT